jgi:hypothetical protein
LPHAELLIPLGRGWTVKPFVAVGLGRAFNGSRAIEGQSGEDLEDRFLSLYAAGISNLFEVKVQDFLLSLGTKLAGAGTSRSDSPVAKAMGRFRTVWKCGTRSGFRSGV